MYRFTTLAIVATALTFCPASTWAGTIIKLGFGTDSKPDIALSNSTLSTFDDEFGATVGDQNTEVTFLGVLGGALFIEGDRASFSLADIAVTEAPTVIGTTVLQPTAGGTFSLYGPSNELLLGGTLGSGTLSGPTGGSATGGFLTTGFGSFTGGSLLTLLDAADLSQSSISIALTDVNDGQGLTIDSQSGNVQDFTADGTANLGAQVPEPSSVVLAIVGLGLVGLGQGRGRLRA